MAHLFVYVLCFIAMSNLFRSETRREGADCRILARWSALPSFHPFGAAKTRCSLRNRRSSPLSSFLPSRQFALMREIGQVSERGPRVSKATATYRQQSTTKGARSTLEKHQSRYSALGRRRSKSIWDVRRLFIQSLLSLIFHTAERVGLAMDGERSNLYKCKCCGAKR